VLGQHGEHEAKDRTDASDHQAFEKDLGEDATHGQTDEPQHADRLAPLVDQHDREGQQEHRRGHDGHHGNGEMKPLQHAKWAGRTRCFA